MAADAGLVRGLPTTPAVISSPDCLPYRDVARTALAASQRLHRALPALCRRAPAVRARLGPRDPATAIVSVGVTGQVLDFYSTTFTSMP
jgi:hypothetical protein